MLDKSQTTSCLDSELYFNIYEPKIPIYDIYIIQWPFYCLTFKCDPDLQLTWTNVSNEEQRQIILKSMHNCTSYDLDKLNLWSFYHLTFMCDLDIQPIWTYVSNCTATPQGEQLCQIILKSMHKCRSYDPDKLNLWPFITWPSSVYLTFNLPQQMLQMTLLLLKEKTMPNYFEIHAQMYKLLPRQVWTDGCMHNAHIHWTLVATTMSHSSQMGSTKMFYQHHIITIWDQRTEGK